MTIASRFSGGCVPVLPDQSCPNTRHNKRGDDERRDRIEFSIEGCDDDREGHHERDSPHDSTDISADCVLIYPQHSHAVTPVSRAVACRLHLSFGTNTGPAFETRAFIVLDLDIL